VIVVKHSNKAQRSHAVGGDAVAARPGNALATQPDLDVSRYLLNSFDNLGQAAYVVLKDGRTGATPEQALRPAVHRQARPVERRQDADC
jgi:hypothetical protein